MSAFPPPSAILPPVNIGQSASTAAANNKAVAPAAESCASPTGSSSTAATMHTTSSVPNMSSIVSGGGQLYGSMMVGTLPAMGGGLGQSAPPSPELGPVSEIAVAVACRYMAGGEVRSDAYKLYPKLSVSIALRAELLCGD